MRHTRFPADIVLGGVLLCAAPASGELILSEDALDAPLIIDFSQFEQPVFVNSGDPPLQLGELVGEDVFLTVTGEHRVGPMNHGLLDNGRWTRTGLLNNDLTAAATITFDDGPVRGVGAFANYAPGLGDNYLIEALGEGGDVLESYDIVESAPIDTPPDSENEGAFRGILREDADIYAYRVSGNFNVMDDLAFSRSTCPADLDGSGDVGFEDILRVLDAWGEKGAPEDIDGSGTVDFGDLLIVLDAWGPCA